MANNVQVRILEDENSSLHELFKAAYDPFSQKQVPFVQRNLPKSFFVPPDGSVEEKGHFHLSKSPLAGLQISHTKAHSSPACLDASSSCLAGASQIQDDSHSHQKSLDTGIDDNCPKSFCPSANPYSSLVKYQQDQGSGENHSCYRSRHDSASMKQQLASRFRICDLPPEFEMAINEDGRVYFLNHHTMDTTWFDPRLPPNIQNWGMTLDVLEQLHMSYAREILSKNNSEGCQMDAFSRQQVTGHHPRSLSQPASMGCSQSVSSLSPSPAPPALAQVLEGLSLTPQHSHQSSLDSGVGQSVAGQSANHTPEHNCHGYDTGLGGCDFNAEFMEGLTYGPEDMNFSDVNLLDAFDINELNV